MNLAKTVLWLAALAVAQACLRQPAHAEESNAVIPYQAMDDMFQPIAAIDSSKLEVLMFVSSTNEAVHPADITLTVQSATQGPIPVAVGTNGQIVTFPHDKKLRSENPSVVSNQPKGSLKLQVTLELPPLSALVFHYNRLGDGVAEVNKAIRAQAGMLLSLLAPKASGVVFVFPKTSAGKAKVVIASASGRKVYTADPEGRVLLKLDKTLLTENPEVQVSEKPPHIVPNFD